jgi:hypothetical protein
MPYPLLALISSPPMCWCPTHTVTLEAWGWSSRLSRRGRVAMKTEQKERLGAHKLMGRMGRGAAFVALYTFPSR